MDRLAGEREIVGRATTAARLRYHESGLCKVVFAAFERVYVLPHHAQAGVTRIVVNVFQSLVDDRAALVVKDFDHVPLPPHDMHEEVEMPREHVGHEDGVRHFHFMSEAGIVVGEVGNAGLRLRGSFATLRMTRRNRGRASGTGSLGSPCRGAVTQ